VHTSREVGLLKPDALRGFSAASTAPEPESGKCWRVKRSPESIPG